MDNIDPIWKLNRIADDNIYLNEERYNQPKISFKKLYELIKKKRKLLISRYWLCYWRIDLLFNAKAS